MSTHNKQWGFLQISPQYKNAIFALVVPSKINSFKKFLFVKFNFRVPLTFTNINWLKQEETRDENAKLAIMPTILFCSKKNLDQLDQFIL